MRHKNTLKRIAIVQEIIDQHYEPGNQSKSQVQILRNVLMKSYPMSERTLRRYMKVNVIKEQEELSNGQLVLEFEE